MPECQKNLCETEAVGTITWSAGTERDYCQEHLQEARDGVGDYIKEVDLA